jgi:MAF protein
MVGWLEIPVDAARVDIDEQPRPDESPSMLAARLALEKSQSLDELPSQAWIIAADTTVDLGGRSLGKPQNPAEAERMLRQLRDRPHEVHTGVALYIPQTQETTVRRVTTRVWMRPYTEVEIAAYVASGDPMDKAGAYAIQNSAFDPVAKVARCYANVVGFPLCAVAALMRASGSALTVDIPELCRRHFGYRCPQPDRGELML